MTATIRSHCHKESIFAKKEKKRKTHNRKIMERALHVQFFVLKLFCLCKECEIRDSCLVHSIHVRFQRLIPRHIILPKIRSGRKKSCRKKLEGSSICTHLIHKENRKTDQTDQRIHLFLLSKCRLKFGQDKINALGLFLD